MSILVFVVLLTVALLLTGGVVFVPESLLRSSHLSFGFSLGVGLLLLSWLIGE
jgi:hypothetical protein